MKAMADFDLTRLWTHLQSLPLPARPQCHPAWPSSSSSASLWPSGPAGWPASCPSVVPSWCADLLSKAQDRYRREISAEPILY